MNESQVPVSQINVEPITDGAGAFPSGGKILGYIDVGSGVWRLRVFPFSANVETPSRKKTTFTGHAPSDDNYPSEKLVYDQLAMKAAKNGSASENFIGKVIGATVSMSTPVLEAGEVWTPALRAADDAGAISVPETEYGTDETFALLSDLAGFVNGGAYNSTSHKIELKHGSTVVAEIDAAPFIKDGMVSTVAISNGNLVITFNTDAGKQPISIPLTSIFNPANYYTKNDTKEFVGGEGDDANAYLYPQIKLGSYSGDGAITSALSDLTDILTEDDTTVQQKYAGTVRLTVNGQNIICVNHILSWANRTWLQVLQGPVGLNAQGQPRLLYDSLRYNILFRTADGGTVGAWQDYMGNKLDAITDTEFNTIFNDW